MAEDAESDSDSNTDSDDKDKDEREDNGRTIKESLKISPGFLSKQNGIFGDNKDSDRTPKPRKTGRGLFSRIKDIFTNNNNDPAEANSNLDNSNINPTHQQKRVK